MRAHDKTEASFQRTLLLFLASGLAVGAMGGFVVGVLMAKGLF